MPENEEHGKYCTGCQILGLLVERQQIATHWAVIRGAQNDMLHGRPDMDAMEEIALASAAIDELLAPGVSGDNQQGEPE